jgi:hypothetical protein
MTSLMRISNAAQRSRTGAGKSATAHMFIINPLTGGHGWTILFVTHPRRNWCTLRPPRKWVRAARPVSVVQRASRPRQAARGARRGGVGWRPYTGALLVASSKLTEFVRQNRRIAFTRRAAGAPARRIAADIADGVLRRPLARRSARWRRRASQTGVAAGPGIAR